MLSYNAPNYSAPPGPLHRFQAFRGLLLRAGRRKDGKGMEGEGTGGREGEGEGVGEEKEGMHVFSPEPICQP